MNTSVRYQSLYPVLIPRRLISFAVLISATLSAQAQPSRLGDLDGDGRVTVLDLVRLIDHIKLQGGAPAPGGSLLPPHLRGYADVSGDGSLNATDVEILADAVLGLPYLTRPRPLASEPAPGAGEVGVTVRPRVYFPKPVIPGTLNANNFYASFAGRNLRARIVPASDGTFAWLFLETPMPSASQISVTVDGSSISVQSGEILDADADGAPGGQFTFDFSTVSVTPIPNTVLTSRIVDPGPDLIPRTADDVTQGGNGFNYLLPISGVKVYLLGLESNFAYTDSTGSFTLTNMPVGNVKVVLEGRTATNPPAGYYFPEMVMDTTFLPGVTNGVMTIRDANGVEVRDPNGVPIRALAMYLPRVASNVLQTVSVTNPTLITLNSNAAYNLPSDQQPFLTVEVQPGSLIGMNGQPMISGQVGVSVVPSELVRDMLPPGLLQHTFDITVQAPGISTFSTPAPMSFPNVFNAPPGTKLNFLSFDHTTGRLVIEGTATVSADGLSVRTDPGSGITHPGWHGLTPPGTETKTPEEEECESFGWEDAWALLDTAGDCVQRFLRSYNALIALAQAVHEGFDLGQSIATLQNGYENGTLTAEQVLDALEALTAVKDHLVEVYEAASRNNPVDKVLEGIRCLTDLTLTGTDRLCEREDCLSTTGMFVCDRVLPAVEFANGLIDDAEELTKSIREAPLAAVCLGFDALLTAVRVSLPGGIAPLIGAPPGPDPNVLQAMNDFQAKSEAFAASFARVDSMVQKVTVIQSALTNALDHGMAQLVVNLGGLRGAYWRMTAGETELRGRTSASGAANLPFIAAEVPYVLEIHDPVHPGVFVARGRSASSGVVTVVTNFQYDPLTGAPDSDFDQLPDAVETIVGTSLTDSDSDHDGMTDLAELQQGLDPLDNRGFPTGLIASLPLPGEAKSVVLEGSLLDSRQMAYLALGPRGMGVVDASQFRRPILFGQLDLPGDATDVAVDSNRGVAVVAANAGGLHFVDVTDPQQPALVQTIGLNGSQVEVVEGIAYATSDSQIVAYDLVNRERLQTLSLDGAVVTGLAREGAFLYTMDANRMLRVIDLSDGNMVIRGSLTLPVGGRSLFVGNRIAYVPAGTGTAGGFCTASVSDPDVPSLLSGVDAANIEGDAIAVNGSGLAVTVGTVRGPQGQSLSALDLLDVEDPANTGSFLTRYPLAGKPLAVSIGAGIAFVAAGTAGVHVVNYRAFDLEGVAPTVILTNLTADLDPDTPGIQALEGSVLRLSVEVSDDVQARNVELLVEGQSVRNDLSFPFDLSANLPTLSAGVTNIELRGRATDTGGNVGLSAPLMVQLVPDTFPPSLVSVNPPEGAIRGTTFRAVTARFSEPLDPDSVSATSLRLHGPAGAVPPLNVQLFNDGLSVQMSYPTLATGIYQIVFSGPLLRDRAGNSLGATDLLSHFEIRAATAVWTAAGGGYWDDPINWDGVLPGPNDDVLIDASGPATITNRLGITSVRSLRTKNAFVLSGGSLLVSDVLEVGDSFILSSGTLRGGTVVTGPSAKPILVRGGTLSGVTLRGDLDVGYTFNGAELTVSNGLVLHGTARVGNPTNGAYGAIHFQGTQELGGNGTVILGNRTPVGYNTLRLPEPGTILTIGPGITVRGQNGEIGFASSWGGPQNVGVLNRGTIAADVAGRVISLWGRPLINAGVINLSGGSVILGGTIPNGGLGTVNRTAYGLLRLDAILDNQNANLILDGTNASWVINGGSILGGTVTVTNDAQLFASGGGGTLDGVALNGDLDVGYTDNAAELTITNGLVLNGIARVGHPANHTYGAIHFAGSQMLDGRGTIIFGNRAPVGYNALRLSRPGTVLTNGPGITLRGQNGAIGYTASWGGPRDVGFINQGTIAADVTSGQLTLWGRPLLNEGEIHLTGGSVNLGGEMTLAGLGTINRTAFGLILLEGILDTEGGHLRLDGTNASWALNGGIVRGGTVTATNDAQLYVAATGGTLDGVTFFGDLDVGYTASRAELVITNGLVLNGTARLGHPTSGAYGVMHFFGSQMLDGEGTIIFGGRAPVGYNAVRVALPGTILTNGPGILIRGDNGAVGYAAAWNGPQNVGFINRGTISADVAGGVISVWGVPLINEGVVNLSAGNVILGGSMTFADLGTVNRLSSGLLTLAGTLDNRGSTVSLDGPNSSWTLYGGAIVGGIITVANGAQFVCANDVNNRLDGVTFNGDLDIGVSSTIGQVTITNGLVLNGTARVGNPTNFWYGGISFHGSQSLGGNGTVVFGTRATAGYNTLRIGYPGTSLTLAPSIQIRGENGTIGYAPAWGGPDNVVVTNRGTISADVPGGTIYLRAQPLENEGVINLSGGNVTLGGTMTYASLGMLQRNASGFVILEGTLDNQGADLLLNGPNASWQLDGGTILGGIVSVTNGARFVIADNRDNKLDSVTFNGDMDLGVSTSAGQVIVANGLVLNGTARVGNPTNNSYGGISFQGSQTLSGNGTVIFGARATAGYNALRSFVAGTTLTLAPSIQIRGENGTIGYAPAWGGPANVGVTNRGTISADVPGGTIYLRAQPLENEGVINLSGGNVTLGGALTYASLGMLQRDARGFVILEGTLDNQGADFVLNGPNASWQLDGGTILGGIVTVANGARFVCADNRVNQLDGVTLNGDVDLGVSTSSGQVIVANGLVLNGTAFVGNPTNNSYGAIHFQGSQTLSGNGRVIFGARATAGYNTLHPYIAGTTLTVAPSILIRGENGTIGYAPAWGGAANIGVTNHGTISADVAGGTLYIRANPFVNTGTTNQLNGGTLVLNP